MVFNYYFIYVDYPDSGFGYWYLVTAIGYYNSQIDKLNMFNWSIGEMGLNT
jgi:hypothetical protein